MANIAPVPDLPEEEGNEPEALQALVIPLCIANYTQWFADAENDPF